MPEMRLPYQERKSSIVHTRAIDNCDLFGKLKTQSEQVKEEPAIEPDPEIQHLLQKVGGFLKKAKNGIAQAPEKLIDYKLTTLIQPDTKYPVDVKKLSPKMKIAVMKLYEYAKKEGIEFQIGQASRPEPQQEAMRNDPEIGKYAAKCSPHVQNIAIDISIVGKDLHEAQADLEKLGKFWKKTTKGRWGGDWYGKHHEPWHFDLKQKRQNLCLNKVNTPKKSEGA